MKKHSILFIALLMSIVVKAQDWHWLIQSPSNSRLEIVSMVFPSPDTGYALKSKLDVYTITESDIIKTTDGGLNWEVKSNVANASVLFFTDVLTGYATGDSGLILKTTDGGSNWAKLLSGTTKKLYSISFPSYNIGYISGDSGTMLKTIDGGMHWASQSTGISSGIPSVSFVNQNIGYAAATDYILKTIDGGTNWTKQYINPWGYYQVFFTDPDTGYASGMDGWGDEVLYKTIDGGLSWTDIFYSGGSSMYFINASIGYITTWSGCIVKTLDGGASWELQCPENSGSLWPIFFTNKDTGYVAGEDGRILKTTDGGSNWLNIITDWSKYGLNSISFSGTKNGVAVGDYGRIVTTNDGGVNWIDHGQEFFTTLNSVCLPSDNTGYAVGREGVILKTSNGGYNWSKLVSGNSQILNSVCFPDVNTGFAVGDSGTILKTINGGSTWQMQNSGTEKGLNSVYFVDMNNGFAVGNQGTILKTTDGGTNWISKTFDSIGTLTSVYFIDQDTGYTVRMSCVLKTTDGGENWTLNYAGPGIYGLAKYSVNFLNADTGYIVGQNGYIWKTINAGVDWLKDTTISTSFELKSICFTNQKTGYIAGTSGILSNRTQSVGFWEIKAKPGEIIIYPNPANDRITIDLQKINPLQNVVISIYDMKGQLLVQQEAWNQKTEIDIEGLAKGAYFAEICNGSEAVVSKFVKK
jgi:photosystem II stability/assembly factor-like uncharacterized protein